MKSFSSREIIALLKRNNWEEVAVRGSLTSLNIRSLPGA
jgi:predicted RNA binding protein YcfA (HicA-like mRNA interferase family)